jgi:hypothetical protein
MNLTDLANLIRYTQDNALPIGIIVMMAVALSLYMIYTYEDRRS